MESYEILRSRQAWSLRMKTRGMLSELTELRSADCDRLVYHTIRCIARLYSIIYGVQYLFEIMALS